MMCLSKKRIIRLLSPSIAAVIRYCHREFDSKMPHVTSDFSQKMLVRQNLKWPLPI